MEPMEPAFFISSLYLHLHRFTRVKCKDKQIQVKKRNFFAFLASTQKERFNTVVHLRALLCVCTCVPRVNHTLRFFTVDISRFQAGGKLSQPQDITSKSAVEPQAGRLVRGNRRVCRSLHQACLHNSDLLCGSL